MVAYPSFSQMKISQYPNTATLGNSDLFIIASGSTNKNIRWGQLYALSIANSQPLSVNLLDWSKIPTNGMENAADALLKQLGSLNLTNWSKLDTNDMVGIYTMATGYLPYAIAGNNLTNSIVSQSGTEITVAGTANATTYKVNGTNGLNATVDVIVSGNTTNRLVFIGGLLVSNIANYSP